MFARFLRPRLSCDLSVSIKKPAALAVAAAAVMVLTCSLGATAQSEGPQSPDGVSSQPATGIADSSTLSTQPAAPGLVHIVPFGRNGQVKNTFAPAGAHLTYWGGPVISQVHVVAVFWGPNVSAEITGPNAIDQFFTDITKSRYYDLLTEYSTTGLTGSGVPATSSNQSIQPGVFDGKFTITPALCATGPCSLTDAQIQTELQKQITNLVLPQPVADAQGNTNTFYMIYFPPGVSISVSGVNSCVQNGFCAYHSNTTNKIPYGVEPDFSAGGCSTGCGNGTLLQKATTVTSHELAEAVTDALVGSATATAPPLAWYDPDPAANPLGEVADICVGQEVTVSAGANSYAVQQEFSNVQNDCVAAPPNFVLNATAAVAPGTPISLKLSVQSSTSATNLAGYTGTVHFTSSDGAAILPADYTFTAADAGTHTFVSGVTFSALGDQTITATDIRSGGFTGSTSVNINVTPDLSVSESRSGGFILGQSGTYNITVSNVGNGPTTAAVSLVDTLPVGLSATSIAGTGWTCNLAGLSCTRADALDRGLSYPPITLNVNIAPNAPSVVTNLVTVSGGGETNTANDSLSDLTPIASPDLIVSKSHVGAILGNFFQGETGATYTISVSNSGSAGTSAPVTVIDTLPASGLTATAIGGTGWSCTLANLTCTRSDVLVPASAYPPITVTVDVALNAPQNLTNTAAVSGGGETNTTNNIALDPTTILPPPATDLTVAVLQLNTFVQGQSGTYGISVSNVGTQATTGTVSVVDTLPAGLSATAISGTGWTCDLASLTCTRSDSLAFGTSYPQITLTVNIAANAPASVTNSAGVSGGGDTTPLNDTAVLQTPIAAPLVDLSISAIPPGTLAQGPNSGAMAIDVQSLGNIASTGTVTVVAALPSALTATALSGGPGWTCTLANLTCTRSDSLSPGVGISGITISLDVASNASGLATGSVSISGGGDGNPANNTSSFSISIQPAVTIISQTSGNSVSVLAGQPAAFQFLASAASTAGALTFNCSGLPTGAACTFNPATVTQTGTAVTMTVTTTSRSSLWILRLPKSLPPPNGLLLVMVAASLVVFFTRFRTRLKPALALTGVLAVLTIAGCGGGGGSTPPPPVTQNPNGTPAGTYSFAVTATGSNNLSASQTFQLVVK